MVLRPLSSLLLLAAATMLCRYTVRDVAFVDLGDEETTLLAFVSASEDAPLAAELRREAEEIFAHSNVGAEVIEVAAEADAATRARLEELGIDTLPVSVLVAPDGRRWTRPLPRAADARRELWRGLVTSPRRDEILDGVIESYGVALLVEGRDAAANAAARDAIDEAFAQVQSIFDTMPKAVGDPPRCVVLPHGERVAEAVLLWSLGIESDAEPTLVVFMGRARRVGPMLRGYEITASGAFGILSVIGLSCECDLDRSWMRGARFPVRWDDDARTRSAAALGFDPGSPMVRAEILGILARGPEERRRGDAARLSPQELLLGYEEVELEARPTAPAPPPAPEAVTEAVAAETATSFHPLEMNGGARSGVLIYLVIVGGLGLLCLVGVGVGFAVMMRGGDKR